MPQYFVGKKASAYERIIFPLLPNGYIEREMRMCAHCGFHWTYSPRSGKTRGICIQCGGLTCGKQECGMGCSLLEKRLENMEGKSNNG